MELTTEIEEAPAGERGQSLGELNTTWRLRLVIAAQILIPATLLGWRLVTGHLPFGGWAWGMYA